MTRKQKIFIEFKSKSFNTLKGKNFTAWSKEASKVKTICKYLFTKLNEVDYPVILVFQPVLVRNKYKNKSAKMLDTINYCYDYKLIEDCLTSIKVKAKRPQYIGRIQCASPATGYASYHAAEQKEIIINALSK